MRTRRLLLGGCGRRNRSLPIQLYAVNSLGLTCMPCEESYIMQGGIYLRPAHEENPQCHFLSRAEGRLPVGTL